MMIDQNMPQPEIPGQAPTQPQADDVPTAEKIKNLEDLLAFVKESPESFEHLGGAEEIIKLIEANLKKFREQG